MTALELPDHRQPNPWSRRLFAAMVNAGSISVALIHGDSWSVALIGLSGAAVGQLFHAVNHTLDMRSLGRLVEKVGAVVRGGSGQ